MSKIITIDEYNKCMNYDAITEIKLHNNGNSKTFYLDNICRFKNLQIFLNESNRCAQIKNMCVVNDMCEKINFIQTNISCGNFSIYIHKNEKLTIYIASCEYDQKDIFLNNLPTNLNILYTNFDILQSQNKLNLPMSLEEIIIVTHTDIDEKTHEKISNLKVPFNFKFYIQLVDTKNIIFLKKICGKVIKKYRFYDNGKFFLLT